MKAFSGWRFRFQSQMAASEATTPDGHNERDRVAEVVVEAGGADGDGGEEADNRERDKDEPQRGDYAAGAPLKIARDLERKPEGAVERERDERNEAADDGIPIENAGQDAGLPVGPEGQKEIAFGIERNAAEHVGQGRSKEDGEKRAGETEDAVKERTPHANVNVVAQFKAHAAEDQQPEHDHEGKIETAEG